MNVRVTIPNKYSIGQSGAWGLFDTLYKCWIGTDKGPLTYDDCVENGKKISGNLLARAAATIANARLGTKFRIQARPFIWTSKVPLDEIKPSYTVEEAMKRIGA